MFCPCVGINLPHLNMTSFNTKLEGPWYFRVTKTTIIILANMQTLCIHTKTDTNYHSKAQKDLTILGRVEPQLTRSFFGHRLVS